MTKKKKEENSVTSSDMEGKKKGLTKEELIEKYGKETNPDFNKALKKATDGNFSSQEYGKPHKGVKKEK